MSYNSPVSMPVKSVAIVGAGPAGLVCARWLAQHSLAPVLFEASGSFGGQWNASCATSGVWPGMRTNTSRVMTAFSDIDHEPDSAVYPAREQMHAYLGRFASRFGLLQHIRFRARVELIARHGDGWLVRSIWNGAPVEEIYSHVVVATGRHVAPRVPRIHGIESFTGLFSAEHTAQYAGAEKYRGRTVLVAGCSISALEIASDLALNGVNVITSYRRQRYVLPKMIAGVPTDHVMFTRAQALAMELAPPEMTAARMKAAILQAAGSPEQYGARPPDENVFAAGITQSQTFLHAVAEGRIETMPWIDGVDGRRVRFEGGAEREVDGLLFGTGFRLSLPFMAPELAEALRLDEQRMDLCDHTFHPDLPGLAFLGLYDLVGPYFPVLEQQARWIAYSFAGVVPGLSRQELWEGVERCRAARGGPEAIPMNAMAILFARRASVEPRWDQWPDLQRALLFGPLSSVSFRLEGPDCLEDAGRRVSAAAAAFGAIRGSALTFEEEKTRQLFEAAASAKAA